MRLLYFEKRPAEVEAALEARIDHLIISAQPHLDRFERLRQEAPARTCYAYDPDMMRHKDEDFPYHIFCKIATRTMHSNRGHQQS